MTTTHDTVNAPATFQISARLLARAITSVLPFTTPGAGRGSALRCVQLIPDVDWRLRAVAAGNYTAATATVHMIDATTAALEQTVVILDYEHAELVAAFARHVADRTTTSRGSGHGPTDELVTARLTRHDDGPMTGAETLTVVSSQEALTVPTSPGCGVDVGDVFGDGLRGDPWAGPAHFDLDLIDKIRQAHPDEPGPTTYVKLRITGADTAIIAEVGDWWQAAIMPVRPGGVR